MEAIKLEIEFIFLMLRQMEHLRRKEDWCNPFTCNLRSCHGNNNYQLSQARRGAQRWRARVTAYAHTVIATN